MTRIFIRIIITLFLSIQGFSVYAEILQDRSVTIISGVVKNTVDNEPVPNISFTAPGQITSKVTDSNGNFELSINQEPPFFITVTAPGYKMKEIEITAGFSTDLIIRLEQEPNEEVLDDESNDEVSVLELPSDIEETYIKAPLTTGRMSYLEMLNSPSSDYYQAMANLKGIDLAVNGIFFPVINSRGFNSTANNRVLQLADGMDLQSPAFNVPLGNLLRPQKLDVASIDFIQGPYSSIYGPNAYNGVLSIESKNPFQYQGLSFQIESGLNHLNGNSTIGEPENPQNFFRSGIRYAIALNDHFAFKLNFNYSQAQDWYANNFSDKNRILQGSRVTNPARDEVHSYGDEEIFNIRSLLSNQDTRRVLTSSLSSQTDISIFDILQYVNALPSQPVTRTGYREFYMMDYGVDNLKANAAIHYRINDSAEAMYLFNFGRGTTSYTGDQRISLNNFRSMQHKLELNSDHLSFMAYATFDHSGDSHFVDFLGQAVNEGYSSSEEWLSAYGAAYLIELYDAAVAAQDGNPNFNFSTIQALLKDPSMVSHFNTAGRNAADANRFIAGSDPFNDFIDTAIQNTLPGGVLLQNNSHLYHVQAQYDFKDRIEFAKLKAGVHFRQLQLRSENTMFDDSGGKGVNEWGGFLTGSKSLFSDLLGLTATFRFDKHQNFNGLFSPSVTAVYNIGKHQFVRASFRTGFSTPTLQSQYINVTAINSRLLGGLSHFAEQYRLNQRSYTLESVYNYQNSFLAGNAFAEDKLLPQQLSDFRCRLLLQHLQRL